MGARVSRLGRHGVPQLAQSVARQRDLASAIRLLEREASVDTTLTKVLERHGASRASEIEPARLSDAAELRSVARGLVEEKEVRLAVEVWRRLKGDEARYAEAMCLVELGDTQSAKELLAPLEEQPQALYNLALLTEDRSSRLRLLVKAAKRGSREAIKNAANAFASGDGCTPGHESDAKALKLYEVAAELGDLDAAFQVGSFYCAGRGTPTPDWDKGFDFHFVAAQGGLPKAQFNLGTHYFTGKGVPQDFVKAADCFERAANAGIPQAMLNLANMLESGLGRHRDIARAAELREKGASLLDRPQPQQASSEAEPQDTNPREEGALVLDGQQPRRASSDAGAPATA